MSEVKQSYAYLRLSKEDGDVADGNSAESQSIASQRVYIQQYRNTHSEIHGDFEEIVDDGYSGTHFERPGIKRLLKLVELDLVDTIIVKDLSRFARNYLEAGHYLEFVFPSHNVRFISINDGYDSSECGDTTTGLHIAIKNLINQMYSRDISRKIKSAVDLKKMNGEYVYGTAPYGYKKGAVKNTIIVDEPAALVVKRIFSMACDGKTITEICRALNADSVVTPSVYLASVRGKYKTRSFWTYESVRNILSNRIYTGDTVPFKSHVVRVGSDKVKHISEANQTVIPETHEAIISREMFFRAKGVVKSNVKSASKGKSSVLSAYLICGCCGNRLTKGKAQNKTFLCASARYNTESDCKGIRCNEEKMKSILIKAIRSQCMMMDAHIQKLRSNAKSHKGQLDTVKAEIRTCRRVLESTQDAKMQLYEDYITGKFGKEDYLAKKSELNKAEGDSKIQLTLLEERQEQLITSGSDTSSFVDEEKLVGKYRDISTLDDELMRELISRIIVYPNGAINIVWNFKDIFEDSKQV